MAAAAAVHSVARAGDIWDGTLRLFVNMADYPSPFWPGDANAQRRLLIDHLRVAFKASILFKAPLTMENICLPAVSPRPAAAKTEGGA